MCGGNPLVSSYASLKAHMEYRGLPILLVSTMWFWITRLGRMVLILKK